MGRYPQTRGALIPALHVVQDANQGFLTKEDMADLADLFSLDPAEVESVASFYTMFYYRPPGKCLIQVCGNIACMLDGAYHLLDHLRERLGIGPGEVTEDGLFGLMEVECLAACDAAPCVQLNDRHFYRKVTPDQVEKIIRHFQMGGEHPAPGAEPMLLDFASRPAMLPLEPIERTAPPQAAATPAAAPPSPTGAPLPKTAQAVAPEARTAEVPDVALKAHAEAIARLEAAKRAAEEARKRAEEEAEREKLRAIDEARIRDERLKEEARAREIMLERERQELRRRQRETEGAHNSQPPLAPGTHPGEVRREGQGATQETVGTIEAKREAETGVDVPTQIPRESPEGPPRVSPPRGPVLPESGTTFRRIEP
ncbi:MAG TPA: NAD(P)H-dependent oxidoreductase subunit E, partial [bacterium]|nr:NAD(P)H-dependent oxidoreductase subunit E [bacterium]